MNRKMTWIFRRVAGATALTVTRAALVLLVMMLTAATASAAVGDVVASGTCGDNLTWTLTENGEKVYKKPNTYTGLTLTISGTGEMTGSFNPSLTSDQKYRQITNVVIEEGVTSINHINLKGFVYMRRISLPTSLTTIDAGAFTGSKSLKTITIPDGVKTIEYRLFYQCDSLHQVTFGTGLNLLDSRAFTKCPRLKTLRFTSTTPPEVYYTFDDYKELNAIVVPAESYDAYINDDDFPYYSNMIREVINTNDEYNYIIRPDQTTLFEKGTTDEWTSWCDDIAYAAPAGAEVYIIADVEGSVVKLNRITATVLDPNDHTQRALVPAYTPVLIKRQSGTLKADLKMSYVPGGELIPENSWYVSVYNISENNDYVSYNNNPTDHRPQRVRADVMATTSYGYNSMVYYKSKTLWHGGGADYDNDYVLAYFGSGFYAGNAGRTSYENTLWASVINNGFKNYAFEGDKFRLIEDDKIYFTGSTIKGVPPHRCVLQLDNAPTSTLTLSVNEYTEVNLSDNSDNTSAIATAAASSMTNSRITLSGRTLYLDGDWNTICLPFDVPENNKRERMFFLNWDVETNVVVMELDTEGTYNGHQTGFDAEAETLYLNFKKATSIEAGKPYIVKWNYRSGSISNPVFYDAAITSTAPTPVSSADGKVTFTGTYSAVEFSPNRSILYLGAANKLYWPNANMTLGACRAYFQLNGITVADVANAQMFINDDGDNGDNEATEITTTNYTNLTNYSDAWYTLDGRRINGKPTQKGVYINGGRKVVIK